jgi:hypothetical protein
MRHLLSILAALYLCAAPAQAQTIKALMYNTNGQVVYSGTNSLSFTNSIFFTSDVFGLSFEAASGSNFTQVTPDGVAFSGSTQKENTRANLGFATNLNTLWTATNASNARSAIGLSATWLTNTILTNFRTAIGVGAFSSFEGFAVLVDESNNAVMSTEGGVPVFYSGLTFATNTAEAATRTNLSLGATNIVTFAGLTNNGDITINQTTATNGLLFIRRTNNEAFLGMANLIASNNTTVSNETLFRVGVAEATNRSAQFGFRTVRTNNGGEGFATFSVFGYNALMMIGPSDRSRTNTATNAGIEADIWTITPTNRVMTLRDTNSGALTLHQDLGFGAGLTNTAPTNTNTPAVWMRVWVGTNNYRLPLYQ